MNKAVFPSCLILMALSFGSPVPAAPPVVPPPSSAPTMFRDWTLACREDCAASTAVRSTQVPKRELLRLKITATGGGRLSIVTALPLYLPDAASLTLGRSEPREIPWLTCRATGCEGRIPLDPDLNRALRSERDGSVALTLLDGTRVRLGVSLSGFTAASKALGIKSDP